jgi:hypothetical protein
MELQDGLNITLGGTTLALVAKEIFAWLRARSQKTEITPDPLNVRKEDKYVTRGEFNRYVEQNAAEHKAIVDDRERNYEVLYNRQLANDKLTSEIKGKLDGIKDDLSLIKNKLFKTR